MTIHETTSDTSPPVAGAISIAPGPDKYLQILKMHPEMRYVPDLHQRTELFHTELVEALRNFGVGDVLRLCLMRGAGGRDVLIITIDVSSDATVRTYTVIFPFNAEPFSDPGWVASEIVRQSSAAKMSLHPESSGAILAVEPGCQ